MTPQSVTYSADGACATFGFAFAVLDGMDLEVLLNGTVQASGFTILGGDGVAPGGAVVFASAPAAGSAVTLRRTGKVQVSGSDAPGFLEAKIAAGANVTVTKTSDSSGEHLTIAATADPALFLRKDQNLADLPDKAAARGNLGLGSAATHAETDFATAAQGAKADSALQTSDIGSSVQAHDADLDWVAANLSAAGRALIDDADAAAQRTTLELGSAAVLNAGTSANQVVQLDATGKLPAVEGSAVTNLNAGNLTLGTVAAARLGSGTADASSFLRGDGTWVPVSRLASPLYFSGIQAFSTAGTSNWTVPASITSCFVELWGGGAGGNGAAGSSSPCYGGGYAARHVSGITPGSSISVTVGSGGMGSSGTGGSGGTSSFGAYMSATGGAAHISPGVGSGGEINIASQQGEMGTGTRASSSALGGLFWKAGSGGRHSDTVNGTNGTQPGGAGGNGYLATGGNGAPGMVIVYW